MSYKPSAPISMPFTEWPEMDRALWQAAGRVSQFAIKPVPLAKWSPAQVQTAAKHYGLWLRYLESTAPEVLAVEPAERMTAARFAQFLARRRAEVSVSSLSKYVCDLYGVMMSLASKQDWTWLRQMRQMVSMHARRQPPKSRAFTHAADLLHVGQALIDTSFAGGRKIQNPISFRDGLIILMLTLVPVRITQFSLIRLDEHLVQNRDGEWLLRWDAEETKTRRAMTYPLPPELLEVLRLYIRDVRPSLLARQKLETDTGALWIGVSGRPVSSQVLRKVIEARTKAALGYQVNPHAFRASAASSYAIEAPEHAREASALLDHTNPRTTERYYLIGQRERHLLAVHALLRKQCKLAQ